MARRKLAVGLAAVLAVLAAGLVGAVAFFELSKRDYRLVWLLRRTKRIELSYPLWGSRVIEINDQAEVAAIVSAMTFRLDRAMPRRQRSLSIPIHFVLDNSEEIVVLENSSEGEEGWSSCLIRFSGGGFRSYTTSPDIGRLLRRYLRERRRIPLGNIVVCGEQVSVDLDYSLESRGFIGRSGLNSSRGRPRKNSRRYELTFRSATPQLSYKPNVALYCRLIGKGGVTDDCDTGISGDLTLVLRPEIDLDDLRSVEVKIEGVPVPVELPPLRFDPIIVPACPSCGSEERVVPWIYNWDGTPPFHGRGKVAEHPEREDSPQFFCERCNSSV